MTTRPAAASWRRAAGRVVMCREISYPSFYPGLVEPEDLVMRKTGFSAVGAGNLLEILAEHRWDTVVMGGLTTPICVGTTSDDLSMAGLKVVILEDACASQPF